MVRCQLMASVTRLASYFTSLALLSRFTQTCHKKDFTAKRAPKKTSPLERFIDEMCKVAQSLAEKRSELLLYKASVQQQSQASNYTRLPRIDTLESTPLPSL